MQENRRLPEVIVFAGPNGSGKTTITKLAKVIEPYINADDIRKTTHCSDMDAAVMAEKLREEALADRKDFTFETVLSTDRNLKLLKKAKAEGYFIRCIYVLTSNPEINILRVDTRKENGGHSVPENKIVERYHRCMKLLPELISVCDVIHIYDNTDVPFRIFKKRKREYYFWENSFWSREQIKILTRIS